MNPLDDHELRLWAMRAGLTRDEVCQAVRAGQPAPDAPFIWRLYRLWKEWGVSPLELIKWPVELVEGFQVCVVVEMERSPGTGRNLPVADAPWCRQVLKQTGYCPTGRISRRKPKAKRSAACGGWAALEFYPGSSKAPTRTNAPSIRTGAHSLALSSEANRTSSA